MAKFNMADADNYGSGSGGSFFSLKDDKDTAKVRFLYNGIEDVEGYAVHEVELNDKKRYVNCLRAYNEPIDKCPCCAAQMRVIPKLFIKLFNEDANECQIWERGKTYFQRLGSLAARYNPLVNEIIEIERNGKKGDMKTSYEFYPLENAPVNLSDYDCPEPLGTIVLDKTADEMNTYLDTGEFPEADGSSSGGSSTKNSEETPWDNRPTGRRTPSTNNRRAF